MIRAGVSLLALGVVLYVIESLMMSGTPPGAGANIGAGLLALLNLFLLVIGVTLAAIGVVGVAARPPEKVITGAVGTSRSPLQRRTS